MAVQSSHCMLFLGRLKAKTTNKMEKLQSEVESLIHDLTVINCNGFKTNIPSQKHHDCCMMPFEKQIHIYFEQAFETCMVNETSCSMSNKKQKENY